MRRASLKISIQGNGVSQDLAQHLLPLAYTDKADNALNDQQITLKDGYFTLKKEDFRSFQNSSGYGINFLVLSTPHIVENFHEASYETTCA